MTRVIEGEKLLTARQVATILGVHVLTVHLWVREGLLPRPLKIGHFARWKASEIDRWVDHLSS
ncbi:MAG: helix-turn-helix domain-containing protein [Chloroflexi bacterium]|nr:helix-turn-helix domain-containing protein [Chloroflexota bacterium]